MLCGHCIACDTWIYGQITSLSYPRTHSVDMVIPLPSWIFKRMGKLQSIYLDLPEWHKINDTVFLFRRPARHLFIRISVLPASAFENLNSLETLNIQNNKLSRISEEVMEPIIDTLRVVDIVGKSYNFQINVTSLHFYQSSLNWLHILIKW